MFKKILIANRGEIACRIARTCRRMGIAAAGIHSAADADALHVKSIGESVLIGAARAADSYLRIDAVIEAARASGAEAIHPGFGFLAENPKFARAVEAAGLVFIGPTADVIERLGDKAAAKQEAEAADLPTVPGSKTPSDNADEIARFVRDIELPVILKAAAGGGGKGMRSILKLDGLEGEIESAMREAKNSFEHPGLIVERFVERGRHIEVQIAGDGAGNVIHLFERECTLQRRYQKVIEEAPAENLNPEIRDRMLADAVRLARRLNYRGIGTVEFILDGDRYYFLEVNPRIQVEHPVTEMVTGIDIVELMIRIAAGEGLSIGQDDIRLDGHAVEARICAEDAENEFLPSTGKISYVNFPDKNIRIESGIESGSTITPYYDSMLAKLIAHGASRDQAFDRLRLALDETSIFGITSNVEFLKRLLVHPATRNASFHTSLIDDQLCQLVIDQSSTDPEVLAIGAYFWLARQRQSPGEPWASPDLTGWQMTDGSDGLSPIPLLRFEAARRSAEIRFAPLLPDGSLLVGIDDTKLKVKLCAIAGQEFIAIIGSRQRLVRIHGDSDRIFVQDREKTHALAAIPYLAYSSAAVEPSGQMRAPMMGLILKVNVSVGDRVKSGQVAVVMESMKMELRITSETDGLVTAVNFRAGDIVERNAIVVVVEPE